MDNEESISSVGVGDETITQENMEKIQSMSKEEIEAAQKAILQ